MSGIVAGNLTFHPGGDDRMSCLRLRAAPSREIQLFHHRYHCPSYDLSVQLRSMSEGAIRVFETFLRPRKRSANGSRPDLQLDPSACFAQDRLVEKSHRQNFLPIIPFQKFSP